MSRISKEQKVKDEDFFADDYLDEGLSHPSDLVIDEEDQLEEDTDCDEVPAKKKRSSRR